MSKLGVGRKNAENRVKADTVPHPKVGEQGGRMYEIDAPLERLMHTIGAGFFNEPTYYQSGSENADGAGESAQSLMKTMREAAAQDPEAYLCILCWARDDLRLRSTPEVGLAIAAVDDGCKPHIRRYAPRILTRLDQVCSAFAAFRHLYQRSGSRHSGTLPHAFGKALGDRISNADEYEILKYQGGQPPRLSDVLIMIRKYGSFVPKSLFEYIVNGTEPEGYPRISARMRFDRADTLDEALAWAKEGAVTWDRMLMRFGNVDKKRLWEWLLDEDALPYMALLRNLRNIAESEVDASRLQAVADQISKPENVENSKQLPFRFYSAYREMEKIGCQSLMAACDAALDISVRNLPRLPGASLALVDLSGSMDQCVSRRSQISMKEVAAVLAAILAKTQGEGSWIYAFAASHKRIVFNPRESAMSCVERILRTNVGHATIPGPAVMECVKKKAEFDRIVILSDMCCYRDSWSGRWGGGESVTLPEALAEYESRIGPVWTYSCNLSGDSQGSQADPKNKRVMLVSGFSEKIMDLFRQFEGIEDAETEGKSIPSIDQIRERYLVRD